MQPHGLEQLTEIALQREIVQPLLQRLGFRGIRDTSGPQEKGKDIVAVLDDAFGVPNLYAIQLKKLRVSAKAGSSASFGVLLDQLRQAVLEPALDPLTETLRTPDRVIFITPYAIPVRAREAFYERARSAELRNLEIIDGGRLLELIAKHAPDLVSRFDLATQYRLLAARDAGRAHEAVLALQLSSELDLAKIYVQLSFGAFPGAQDLLTAPDGLSSLHLEISKAEEIAETVRKYLPDEREHNSEKPAHDLATILSPLRSAAKDHRGMLSVLAAPDAAPESCQRVFDKAVTIRACTSALLRHQFLRDHLGQLAPAGSQRRQAELYSVALPNLLKSTHPVVVLGGPGAGKSTLLKRIVTELLKTDHSRLPVLVRLYDVHAPTMSALLLSCRSVLAQHGLTAGGQPSASFVAERLHSGELVLCLDGLDECGAKAPAIWHAIRQLEDSHPAAKFILSCRDTVGLEWSNAVTVHLAPFSDRQLEQFIGNWFAVEADRARLLDWLVRTPSMRELSRTPLIAALLCSLVDARAELPDTESDLYASRFELLLGRWDRAKGLVTLPPVAQRRYMSFLQGLAMSLQRAERRQSGVEEAVSLAKRFMVKGLHSSPNELVDDCVRRGILEVQVSGDVSFGHLTNQEFLAAGWLVRENPVEFIWNCLLQPWWSKVLEFYARQKEDLSSLLNFGSQFLHEDHSHEMLVHLVRLAPLTTDRALARYHRTSGPGRKRYYDWTKPAPALDIS